QPVAEEEAHRLQVDGRARHQLARLLAVEERQLEPLEVPVKAFAQASLAAQRDASGDQPPRDAQPEAQDAGDPDRDRPRDQDASVMMLNAVDRPAGQERDQDRRSHRPEREHERPADARSVWTKETEQTPES